MKVFKLLLSALPIVHVLSSAAQEDISGVWGGVLSVNTNTSISVQFDFSIGSQGEYVGELSAPGQDSMDNVSISDIMLVDGLLNLEVPELNGSYEGKVTAAEIRGTWSQQGDSFPLVLEPFSVPLLSIEAQELLMGSWVGALKLSPNNEATTPIVARFEVSDNAEFEAYIDSPSQGVIGLEVTKLSLDNQGVEIEIGSIRASYSGVIEDDNIVGTWKQLDKGYALTFSRGEHVADGLDVSDENWDLLAGEWEGNVGPRRTILHFDRSSNGSKTASIENPDQGARRALVSDIEFDGSAIVVKIESVRGVLEGAFTNETITGIWTQAGVQLPITLTRK